MFCGARGEYHTRTQTLNYETLIDFSHRESLSRMVFIPSTGHTMFIQVIYSRSTNNTPLSYTCVPTYVYLSSQYTIPSPGGVHSKIPSSHTYSTVILSLYLHTHLASTCHPSGMHNVRSDSYLVVRFFFRGCSVSWCWLLEKKIGSGPSRRAWIYR